MKKVFFLIVVVFCLVGNVWGQAPSVTTSVTDVTCKDKNDGTVTAYISNVAGPYNVRIVQGTSEFGRENNTYDTEITFNDIPFSTQSYSVQVRSIGAGGADGSIIAVTTAAIRISQPDNVFEVIDRKSTRLNSSH